MINQITNTINIMHHSSIALYKETQAVYSELSDLVYKSLSCLCASGDSGIAYSDLVGAKTLLENENKTDSNAYKLINTMLEKFNVMTSNGESITLEDFSAVVSFSVAQNFLKSSFIEGLDFDSIINIDEDLVEKFGLENARTFAVLKFLNSLSDETVYKVLYKMKNAEARQHRNFNQNYTDFRELTKQDITIPINIRV